MRLSAARAEVQRVLQRLVRVLDLGDWTVRVEYVALGGNGALATCTADPKYQRAIVQIDPDMAEDEAELRRTLLHELLHVVLADCRIVEVASSSIAGHLGSAAADAVSTVCTEAIERQVRSVERMLELGLGITVEDLADGVWGPD